MSDQMSSYYDCLRKTLKWYRKVVLELITGTAMVNSWIVYNMTHDKIPMIDFREMVARGLLEKNDSESEEDIRGRRSTQTLVKKIGPLNKTRKRCVECYKSWRSIGLSSHKAGKYFL